MDGESRLVLLQKYVISKGYDRIVTLHDLPKTKNRAELIRKASEIIAKCEFEVQKCKVLLEHLVKVRFHVNKETGYVDQKKFKNNGSQHSGDVLGYLAVAIEMGYMAYARLSIQDQTRPQPVSGGSRGNPQYSYLRKK